ncbi:hypothetical protein WICPIJ_002418 [Wickerhamomyces pijperi]|uniref:FAD-binding FR-type domain-containing protein n=1 Tax=Wickerhamomyces pijperi TaxID=599730 RepID=A0A9P8QBX8_WICPI|nr:hypothetical protein WICPIJ_002418 [Wickerhamomyces pijperi]
MKPHSLIPSSYLIVSLLVGLLYQTQPTQSLVILDSILATKCIYYMKQFNWGCNSTSQSAKYYSCRCHNEQWISSIGNCIESEGLNMTQGERDQAYRHVRQRCQNKGRIDYSVDVLKYFQTQGLAQLREANDQDKKTLITEGVVLGVNSTGFQLSKTTFDHLQSQVIRSQWFAWGYVWIICALIFIGMVVNLLNLVWVKNRLPLVKRPFDLLQVKFNNNVPGFLKYFLPTNISDTLIISLFLIYQILATTTGYTILLPNLYQNTHTYQLLDFIGYRSALNSFSMIPLLFFFGIRNNPFIQLTGITITRFLTFHKVLAWSMTIQALIHSLVWTIYTVIEGDYASWAVDLYWQCGIIGMVCPFLIIGFSHSWVRSTCYELFLLVHQSFSVLFIAMMWYHCNIMGWMGWIYATIVIWGYDRIVRFVSVLMNGGVKPCKLTKLNDELIRVVVEAPNSERESIWHSGAFAYLYFLDLKLRFYQSHPFSVMRSQRVKDRNCFVFVIQVKRGITKKLLQVLDSSHVTSDSKYVNVLMEGPYGAYKPLNQHDQYIFIAGGIGFTAVYSHIVELIQSREKAVVKLYWVVRSDKYWGFFKEDLDYLLDYGVEVVVYVTRNNKKSSGVKSDSHELETFGVSPFDSQEDYEQEQLLQSHDKPTENQLQTIHLPNKRPSLTRIVNEAILPSANSTSDYTEHDISRQTASTLFISSGPKSFNETVRIQVGLLKQGDKFQNIVDFREESFEF